MIKVTAAEFRERLDYFEDRAQHEPVEVDRSGAPAVVLLSADEYRRLLGGRRAVLLAGQFSDADLAEIASTEGRAELADLNAELDKH